MSFDKKIIAMVQARTSSQRLNGKVLRPIEGKALIQYLLDNLKRSKSLNSYVLTTSDQESDDELAAYLENNNEPYFRGSLNCVAERILSAAEHYNADIIVRLSGDSPLLDYRLVDQAVSLFQTHDVDLVSNVVVRTFPKGQSVEVMSTKTLEEICASGLSSEENEHVTPRFYQQKDKFKIHNFKYGKPLPNLQLSVDTPDDFTACENIIKSMTRPHWSYTLSQIISLHDQRLDETL